MPRIRKNKNQSALSAAPFWKIGLYIRLSNEDEADGDSESVVNQELVLRNYVEKHFELETYVIVDIYADDGRSGTDTNRPAFKGLESAILRDEVNCMIVKNLSRAFRNLGDQDRFLEEFVPTHNLRFVCIGSPFVDTYSNPGSETSLEVPMNGIINQEIAKKASKDVREVFNAKREEGQFIGAFAAYGYKKDPENKNRLLIDELAAPVVRSIFKMFVYEGGSKSGIAKYLNQQGEANPSEFKRRNGMKYQNPNSHVNDGLWSASTIARILQNPMYIGTMVQGRNRVISYKVHNQISVPESEWYVVPDTHEAIVDKDTFEKAQSLHKRDTRTAPGKREVHMFAGLIRCPDCGKAMHRKTARDIVYFSCRSYRDKKVCTKHSIRKDKLESIVLKTLQKQIELSDMLSHEIDRINKAPVVHAESKRLYDSLKAAEAMLSKRHKAQDDLYFDWKGEVITKEEYFRLKAKTIEEIEKLEQRISVLREEMQVFKDGISSDDPYLVAFLKHRNIQSLNRGILVELVDAIWVYEGGEIMIDLKFADQYQLIIEYIENNRNNIVALEQKPAV